MDQDKKDVISLAEMEVNTEGIIHKLESGAAFQSRLQALNIRTGKRIKKISANPFRGPIVVEVDSSRVAIGYGMAQKVMVEIATRKKPS
ncbi:MAG: FeoA family protein [bacterium]